MVKGINAERDFKKFGATKVVTVRSAITDESTTLLSTVVDASTADKGVDNITLNMVMRDLAHSQARVGDTDKAEATLDRMVSVFKKKQLKPYVIRVIETQAMDAKAAL